MPLDREFIREMENRYRDSEPEFLMMSRKLEALASGTGSPHRETYGSLSQARERFLRKLEYLRRFEAMEEQLSHATRVELMKSWMEYRSRLSELESKLARGTISPTRPPTP